MTIKSTFLFFVGMGALALMGFQGQHGAAPMAMGIAEAVAVVSPTEGQKARGLIRFVKTDRGIRIVGEVSGLTPNSKHGFHIHEFGDLRSTDGTSLGGHYNPAGHAHGLTHERSRHAGDLGNLEANAAGVAKVDREFIGFSLDGHQAPILGRGLVVHEKADDGGQPTGNAGGRIAVGVIGAAKG